ncbi:MAG: hypothetical protein R3B72_33095 [Polyangiaceae bacterium]
MPSPLVAIDRALSDDMRSLSFADPVTHVYNPLDYAREVHEAFLERFGKGKKDVLLIGMNPGPWGMAQTGVPFGDVSSVRDWMKLRGRIGKPAHEHPKRLVEGFDCPRSEVSGSRLWGWAKERYGRPQAFFKRFFVVNYCPLAFLEASGRNRTPDRLPKEEREPLEARCDEALRASYDVLRPKHVIGIGGWAQKTARRALEGRVEEVGVMLHPSPASPIANRGWAPRAEQDLLAAGITL